MKQAVTSQVKVIELQKMGQGNIMIEGKDPKLIAHM